MPLPEAIRFSLLNVGYANNNEHWNYGPICSSFSRIYLVTKGEAFVETGGQRHRLTPMHVYLIPALTTHYDISHGPFEHYYIHFIDSSQRVLDLFQKYELPFELGLEPGYIETFRALIADYPGFALRQTLPSTYDNNTNNMMSLQNFENQPLGRRMRVNGIIHIMLSRFFMSAHEREPVTDDRIAKALWLIERDIASPPTLDDLAAAASLGKERFIRLFKNQTGLTPKAYIINKKVTQAQEMLLSKKYSVKEVALRLGYESWSYFGRQFKSVTGMSPMRFVMQNR